MASPAQNAHEVLLAPFLQLSTYEEQRRAWVLGLLINSLPLIMMTGYVDLLDT